MYHRTEDRTAEVARGRGRRIGIKMRTGTRGRIQEPRTKGHSTVSHEDNDEGTDEEVDHVVSEADHVVGDGDKGEGVDDVEWKL